MALSRIWSAFIIVAIGVGLYQYFSGEKNIFTRMVTGRADEAYETVTYMMIGSPEKAGYTSRAAFADYLAGYGYKAADSAQVPSVVISDHPANDSVRMLQSVHPSVKIY